MTPFSEVLINQLDDLERSFKVLAQRLPEAAGLLGSVGRPVPQELVRDLATSAEQFEVIKGEALKLSESAAGLPPGPELGSVQDLRTFMQTVSEAIEKQGAYRSIQQTACGVLEKVLTVTHVEGIEFAPLLQCQEKARGLRDQIAATAWPDIHPEADAVARGQHILVEFVKLVSFHDQLEDEEWERLQDVVNRSLGKPLGLAASRGKLILSTPAPSEPQAPASVAHPATETAPGQSVENGPQEMGAAGGVPAVRNEEKSEGLHSEEVALPVEQTTNPPSLPPPVTGGEAVTALHNLEVSAKPTLQPVGPSGSNGEASTDQVRNSPAPQPSGVVTSATTFEGTLDDIRYMLVLDLIDSKGMAKALSSKIIAASNAAAGGDKKTAEDLLKAFINEVNAQTGKRISGAAPQLLLTDATSLLGQLQ